MLHVQDLLLSSLIYEDYLVYKLLAFCHDPFFVDEGENTDTGHLSHYVVSWAYP